MGAVFVKTYNELPFNLSEILRYSGCNEASDEINFLMQECIDEIRGKLAYKICYCEFDIGIVDEEINLGFTSVSSKALKKNLSDCKKIVLFAATIGLEIDRLIAKYSRTSPSKALIFQAIGAERIESLCDTFNQEIESEFLEKGFHTKPRFSPGYGDLPIELQRDIFRVLDCPRKIGLSLNESMLMSPSKSVTAIIGITDAQPILHTKKCEGCNVDCTFRRK